MTQRDVRHEIKNGDDNDKNFFLSGIKPKCVIVTRGFSCVGVQTGKSHMMPDKSESLETGLHTSSSNLACF